jgi:hypothetical protein
MTSVPASLLRITRAVAIGALLLLAAGCSNGQLVDAGGDRGQGGLAFVLMTAFFWLFFGALFYMDRVGRRRRAAREEQQQDS